MTGRINNVQILDKDGVPAFAVIPYDEYLALTESSDNEVYLPTEVVEMTLEGDSLIKAWRRYKKMSQVELAEKIGVTQGAIAQVEKSEKPHRNTVKKIADAMGLRPEHLTD